MVRADRFRVAAVNLVNVTNRGGTQFVADDEQGQARGQKLGPAPILFAGKPNAKRRAPA